MYLMRTRMRVLILIVVVMVLGCSARPESRGGRPQSNARGQTDRTLNNGRPIHGRHGPRSSESSDVSSDSSGDHDGPVLSEKEGSCVFNITSVTQELSFITTVVFSEDICGFEINSPFDVLVRRQNGRHRRSLKDDRKGRGERSVDSAEDEDISENASESQEDEDVSENDPENLELENQRKKRGLNTKEIRSVRPHGPMPSRRFIVTNIEQLEIQQYVMNFRYRYDNSTSPTYYCIYGCSSPQPEQTTEQPTTSNSGPGAPAIIA